MIPWAAFEAALAVNELVQRGFPQIERPSGVSPARTQHSPDDASSIHPKYPVVSRVSNEQQVALLVNGDTPRLIEP